MANCANHPQSTATAYCRTCGKPLCDECKRDVRGVIYCEDCIVARLQGAPAGSGFSAPPPRPGGASNRGLPNPTLAAFLGFIPGVGAMYNGQFIKGIVHVLMFPALIAMVEQVDAFGILFPFYLFYMVIDAYKTALAKQRNEKPPDYLGLNSLFGAEVPSEVAGAMASAEPVRTGPPVPIGAIVLIGLGVLLLMSTMGILPHNFLARGWPVILIVIGAWMAYKRIHMIR
ncbi:MAG: B-box zinc finger protein [Acidobacteriales bacterium]|nr:B-box zinc finger protein [Terriglobales bacterium]